MDVILSIKPEYAELILAGKKRFEFRKMNMLWAHPGDDIYLYATLPVCKIVGKFEIKSIIADSPDSIWKSTEQESPGITLREYQAYYRRAKMGYAYEVTNVMRFDPLLSPDECFVRWSPPQSYRYITPPYYHKGYYYWDFVDPITLTPVNGFNNLPCGLHEYDYPESEYYRADDDRRPTDAGGIMNGDTPYTVTTSFRPFYYHKNKGEATQSVPCGARQATSSVSSEDDRRAEHAETEIQIVYTEIKESNDATVTTVRTQHIPIPNSVSPQVCDECFISDLIEGRIFNIIVPYYKKIGVKLIDDRFIEFILKGVSLDEVYGVMQERMTAYLEELDVSIKRGREWLLKQK